MRFRLYTRRTDRVGVSYDSRKKWLVQLTIWIEINFQARFQPSPVVQVPNTVIYMLPSACSGCSFHKRVPAIYTVRFIGLWYRAITTNRKYEYLLRTMIVGLCTHDNACGYSRVIKRNKPHAGKKNLKEKIRQNWRTFGNR